MAKCPKCGYKLKFYDISQNCPKCKVNMRFYNFEENFVKEAKAAELSKAKAHVKVKRLKASYIGSKYAIARLCVMLLPLVAFVVPAGSFVFSFPAKSFTYELSAMSLYNLYSEGGLDILLSMCNSTLLGAEFTAIRNVVLCYIGAAFFAFMIFALSTFCFASYKNVQKILCVVSGLGIVTSIVAAVMSYTINAPHFSSSKGFGLYVALVTFAVNFFVNLILWKNDIPVEYDEGMLERVEIAKKVKAGQITMEELPQPIVETAKTRKIQEEIEKEKAALYGANNEIEGVAT